MHVTLNGYQWRVASEALRERLQPILERFPEVGELAGARVLKSNRRRQVFHVPDSIGGQSGVIAKVYCYHDALERWRYRLWRSRAEQEWHALARFQALGLPTATALAVAEQRDGLTPCGGGLIIEFLAGTRSLGDVLYDGSPTIESDTPAAARGVSESQRAWLQMAARWIRRLHDGGAWHRDLHAGNLLADEEKDRLYFIDLHSCRFLPRLVRWQREEGLATLLFSLSVSVPPEGLKIFLEAYGVDALRSSNLEELGQQFCSKIEKLRRKHWRSRSERCFLRSTEFDVTRERGARIYRRRAVELPALMPLWARKPSGEVLKSSARGWLVGTTVEERPVCVKYRRYNWLESLQNIFESHRLRRAYGAGHALTVRGLATPRVVALREGRWFGLVREAHLVTEALADAVPLDRFLRSRYGSEVAMIASEKHAVARGIGALVRSIHDFDLYPHDLSPQNILVVDRPGAGTIAGRWQLHLVDLDHLYLWQPLWMRGRCKNLVQVGNLPEGHISTVDLLRGLHAYARGEARFWSHDWMSRLRLQLLDEHLRVILRRRRG